jgi:hypothetical protein
MDPPGITSHEGITERVTGRGFWRSFRTAAWLGWQIESNWTDPFLFAIYSFIKPISTAAILVVMYGIITQGNYESPIFTYMYLGNAFYIYVGAVMAGVSWAVIDDREHYKTLKYMYQYPHVLMRARGGEIHCRNDLSLDHNCIWYAVFTFKN